MRIESRLRSPLLLGLLFGVGLIAVESQGTRHTLRRNVGTMTTATTTSTMIRMRERRRKVFEFEYPDDAYEGSPMDVPSFHLQLFPTTTELDTNSEMILETALQDYLTAVFKQQYPSGVTDSQGNPAPEFVSALIDIVGSKTIAPGGNVRRRQRQQQRRQLQRQGTDVTVKATLYFFDGIFPEDSSLESDLQTALSRNFNVFSTTYLPLYAAGTNSELEGIDSGLYVASSSGASPTTPSPPAAAAPAAPTAPATAPSSPTPSPSKPREVSQINQQAQNNGGKKTAKEYFLYSAIGAGVAMFIITALVLSSKRRRVTAEHRSRYNIDDESMSTRAHISVDFDGRQEALELERERRNEEFAQLEVARRLNATKQQKDQDKNRGRGKSPRRPKIRSFARQDPIPSLLTLPSDSWHTNPDEEEEDWKNLNALVDDISSQDEI